MGGIYPGQSAARIGCDHYTSISALHGGLAVQMKGGGALALSVAVHWVYKLWGFSSHRGECQPPPVFFPGHAASAIK